MIKRAVAPALALCAVAVLAFACGTSDSTPAPETAVPTAEPAPTASVGPPGEGLRPEGPPPGGRTFPPGGRGGAAGLERNSRFVPLDNPEVVSADAATFLQPEDRVLGLTVGGESRAYPISMMTFHHVANDVLGGLPVLVTF